MSTSKPLENLQFAENYDIESLPPYEQAEYKQKRELLKRTKIVKQTWSILEIYQKIREKKLILDPDYQRNYVWKTDKMVSFIESLFMDISIPPLYVVEIPGENILVGSFYEVVDGKQRLTTIKNFIDNKLSLDAKYLEYFGDWFSAKNFDEINLQYPQITKQMLSSVLDIYVITANSPEFTKYDIFSRLNKGSEPLRVNEIRKAIYHSALTRQVETFIKKWESDKTYKEIFSPNQIKRFEDYGRFFRSIAFFIRANETEGIIEKYNSRPRDMINTVLANIQDHKEEIESDIVETILTNTMELLKKLNSNPQKDFIIDACIRFAVNSPSILYGKLDVIITNQKIIDTFKKSSATTSNTNERFRLIRDIVKQWE